MIRLLALGFALSIYLTIFAQGIGTISINFKDPSRSGGFDIGGAPDFPSGASGRDIGSEIYYPATSNGTNAPIIPGNYPVIVFGHGFQMVWSAYENIWQDLVPIGYIMVFPRTEGGLLPAHQDFGADIRLVETLMQQLGNTSGNILNGNISPNAALMGHSMGGGSIYLAAGNNTSTTLKTIVGLAPAETNPSAVSAAANVSVDALVLSGSDDGVTPPADHHLLIYNALNNDCKYFFSLLGAGHCRFANSNFQCDFGETFSGGAGSMSRARVHELTSTIISPWLDFKLKGNCTAWEDFQTVINTEPDLTITDNCGHEVIPDVNITPNGQVNTCASTSLNFQYSPINPDFTYEWFENNTATGQSGVSFSASNVGGYYVQATSAFNCSTNSDTATLTVINPATNTLNVQVCAGNTFTYNSTVISSDTSFIDTLLNASSQGCDSIVTVSVGFTNTLQGNVNETLCAEDTFFFNNTAITDDTLFFDTLANGSSQGCDSITAFNISFRTRSVQADSVTICVGDSFALPDGTFTDSAGTYNLTLNNSFLCDSIYQITLDLDNGISLTSIDLDKLSGDTIALNFNTTSIIDSFSADPNTAEFLFNTGNIASFLLNNNSPIISGTLFSGSCSLNFDYTLTSIRNAAKQNNLHVYPNPVQYTLNTKTQINSYQIFNLLGQLIQSESNTANFSTINTADLANGSYFLRTNKGNALFVKE